MKLSNWLATHVGFFARRWRRRVHEELVADAREKLWIARRDVGVGAQVFVSAIGSVRELEMRGLLVHAVVNERNAMLELTGLRDGAEARLALLRSFENADRAHR